MAKLSTIYDAFDASALDTTLWNDSVGVTQVLGDGYCTVAASGSYSNFLGFTPPSRDFTSDAFQWEWTYPTAVATGAEQYCSIGNGVSGQKFDYGRFSTSLGYFVGSASDFVPWDDVNHRFCRVRTTATQVFFETSSDGTTWVNPFTAGVETLPAWDLTTVQVHFVNGFYSGSGAGDMRIQTAGVDSGVLSGSLAGQFGGISTSINTALSSSGTAAGAFGPARLSAAGSLISRTSLAGLLGGVTVAAAGTFESSAEDVTVSAVGPPRLAALTAGGPVLSPAVAGPVVDRST